MKRLGLALLLVLLSGCAATDSRGSMRASDDEAFQHQGLYVGGYGITQWVGDELEDGGVVMGENDFVIVPAFDDELGGGVLGVVGYRWKRRALEVGYGLTSFGELDFAGTDVDTVVRGIQANWVEHYFVESHLQPFLTAGIEMLDLRLEDAQFHVLNPGSSDAELEGIAINVGGGLSFYLSPRIALTAKLHWSFAEYTEAEGMEVESIEQDINADGWTLSLGGSFTF